MPNFEQINKASVYFHQLIKQKVVRRDDQEWLEYLTDSEIKQTVHVIAKQAGVIVLESANHLHAVVHPEGSLYATNYTQFKEKFPKIKSKVELYLIQFIMIGYISEIDGSLIDKNRWQMDGMTLYKLEQIITEALNKIHRNNLSEEIKLNVAEIYDIWNLKAFIDEDNQRLVASTKTKLSTILYALRIMEEEKLVRIIEDQDSYLCFPMEALYERLDLLYHNQIRYKQIRDLLVNTNKGK